MSIFIYNDKFFKEGENIIAPNNRGLRYGDGLFETIKVNKGIIELEDYHFERLFSGLEILQFAVPKHFTALVFKEKIKELCKKNSHTSLARVRLMVFRGEGGLYDAENHLLNYIIQSWQLDDSEELNSSGLIIDVYPGAKKSCDILANIKSNNFLPYVMAALYAKKIKVNDCIVLNNHNRISDSTIANIFIIKDDRIYTPSLAEGCIAGVMRRFILERLKLKFTIIEKELSINDLQNADEVFLTNSITGVRWVKNFRDKGYSNNITQQIFTAIRQQLL